MRIKFVLLILIVLPISFAKSDHQAKMNLQCSLENFSRLIAKSQKVSTRHQGKVIEDYFNECKDVLTKNQSTGNLASLFTVNFFKYNISENRFAKELRINLDDGTTTRAILVMKQDRRPRPLVIAKCGVLCNLGSGYGVNMLLAHLFDESPFHVLLVGNITGSEYQIDNGAIFFGGISEGRQMIRLAQYLKSSQFMHADRISSVHGVGVSLGGHAQLYASIYNTYATNERGQKPLNSFIAMCPPVDLKASVQEMTRARLLGRRLRHDALITVSDILKAIPEIEPFFAAKNLKKENLAQLSALASLHTEWDRAQNEAWLLPPFTNVFHSIEAFWHATNFLYQDFNQIQTPTLVLYSENDPGVRAETNGERLRSKLTIADTDQIGISSFQFGSHCALSASYPWTYVSALLRSYILSHSPAFKNEMIRRSTTVRWPAIFSLSPQSKYLSQRWSAQRDNAELTLHLEYLNGDYVENTGYSETICRDYLDRNEVPSSCVYVREINVPLTQFSDFNVFTPATETETRMLERWANANLVVKEKNGDGPLERTPGSITWLGEPSQ